jgi:hypothetical protein
MSIQDIYYLISIISTVIFIGVLIFIGFTIWKIYTSISNLEKYVKHDLIDKTASFVNSQKKELEYASRKVNSIEVNGTFYALQKPETFQRWYSETPKDFRLAIKAPQYITHIRRLKDVGSAVIRFLDSGLFDL